MKEKFKWGKFILDCFICFGLMMMASIIFFYPIRWVLAVVDKSASFTATTIIIIFFTLFFCYIIYLSGYKWNKLSCVLSFMALILFSIYIDIILRFYFIK